MLLNYILKDHEKKTMSKRSKVILDISKYPPKSFKKTA